jgi:anti-anti-sigma regulatory factor
MEFSSKIEIKGTQVQIFLTGVCTIYQAKKIHSILSENIKEFDTLILDLKEVTEFHSSILQLVISAKNTAKQLNKKFTVQNHNYSVLQVYDLFGVTALLGDKIHLTKDLRDKLKFKYGTKKIHESKY